MVRIRRHPATTKVVSAFVVILALVSETSGQVQIFQNRLPIRVPGRAAPAAPVAAGDLSGGVVLTENRELKLKLDQVKKLITEKNYSESVQYLGTVLGDPATQDFFLKPDPQQPAGSSFKAELRRILGTLPTEGRQTYELQFGSTAKRLLADSLKQGGEGALRQVALRYPHTQAGDEALFQLACDRWDHGRSREAAACLERLRSLGDQGQRFEPTLSLLLAAAWRQVGDVDKTRQALARLKVQKPASLSIAGKSLPPFPGDDDLLAWLDRALGSPTGALTAPDSLASRREVGTRNVASPAVMPFLGPAWQHEMSSDAAIRESIETAQYSALKRQAPLLPMLHPLAVGDLILMRTPRGVQAFDRVQGRRLWSYPSNDDSLNSGLERQLWDAGAYGALATDDERFYLVEGLPAVPQQIPANVRGGNLVTGEASNTLCARDVAPPRQGNLRWQIGGPAGGDEPLTAGCFFLGPPLVSGDRLYALAESKSALRLLVLDPRSGRQVWSQQLGDVEHSILSDPLRCMAGATPSLCDELVICPTSCGAVIAVDLTTQSLAWAYQYPRTQQSLAARRYGAVIKLEQGDRWVHSAALIGDQCVVVTPVESAELHCLDLASGKLLWKQPRGDLVYAACIEQQRVTLVGKSEIKSLQLADGSAGWPDALLLPSGAMPAGRGVFTPTHYYLPLTDASIAQIDLSRGLITATARSLREIVPGNLIWPRGQFISQGPAYL